MERHSLCWGEESSSVSVVMVGFVVWCRRCFSLVLAKQQTRISK